MSAEPYPTLGEFVEGMKNSPRVADDPILAIVELFRIITVNTIESYEQGTRRNKRLLTRTGKLAHRLGQKCLDLIRNAGMPGIAERTSVLRVVNFIDQFADADDDFFEHDGLLKELIDRSVDQDLPMLALVDAIDALSEDGSLSHAPMSEWLPAYAWKAVFDKADTAIRNHMKILIQKGQAEGGRGSGHNGYRVMLAILTSAQRARLNEQITILSGQAKSKARPRKTHRIARRKAG